MLALGTYPLLSKVLKQDVHVCIHLNKCYHTATILKYVIANEIVRQKYCSNVTLYIFGVRILGV